MKYLKTSLLFLAVIAFCSSGFAQKPPKNQTYSYNNVRWNVLEHDFGTIPQGERVVFNFDFVNLKEEPMFIDNIRTQCGCTAPTWSYDPTAPKAEAKIVIEFDADKEGIFEKYIKVFFKDQRYPDVLLIKAEVEPAEKE